MSAAARGSSPSARPLYREIDGIDIAPDAIRLAQEKGMIARLVNLNTDRAPYPDNMFNTVVTLDVIEHMFDPISFLAELRRVLRPGGHLVLSTPNIRKIQRVLTLIGGRFRGRPMTRSVLMEATFTISRRRICGSCSQHRGLMSSSWTGSAATAVPGSTSWPSACWATGSRRNF